MRSEYGQDRGKGGYQVLDRSLKGRTKALGVSNRRWPSGIDKLDGALINRAKTGFVCELEFGIAGATEKGRSCHDFVVTGTPLCGSTAGRIISAKCSIARSMTLE